METSQQQQEKEQQQLFLTKYPEFRMLDFVSNAMDNAIPVPFTKRRFGLDALIGLVPTAGDMASLGVSGILLLTVVRHGVSFSILLRMIWNIVLDAAVGVIPVVGDFFDFTFKANRRNVALLRAHYSEDSTRMNAWVAAVILFAVILLVFGVVFYFGFTAVGMLWTLIKQSI